MDLNSYLKSLPQGGPANFADRIGISLVYLTQLAAKQDGRQPSPTLCVVIERATDRLVARPDLREDWKEIWPELVSKQAA